MRRNETANNGGDQEVFIEPTATLIARCAEETRRFLRQVPYTERYCYALFRRALVERDTVAWEGLDACYRVLIARWITQLAPPDAVDELINAAFARFWMAIDGAKFARFADLRGLLQYLKLCVRAAVLDMRRTAARRNVEVALDRDDDDDDGGAGMRFGLAIADDVEADVLAEERREAIWKAIREHLHDEQEAVLVRLCFIEGLSPREICRQAPTLFPEIADVYRLKRNVLDRLRRSPIMQELAGSPPPVAERMTRVSRRGL